jgi:lipoate-protein ligase A
LLADLGIAVTVWRLIHDEGVPAAAGLATDEALMLRYARDHEPAEEAATMRLYTYRPHCALIGRYQDLEAEVDIDACRRRGIEVARRPTGGGAIIMGPGQLGVAVTTRAPAGIGPRDLLRQYAGGIVTGLARLGVAARFRGKNDLEVAGRKIAGLGLYVDDRGALLFHASVLADLDVSLMLSVLRIPGAKLADKGAARVHERVTTVSRECGRRFAGLDLRDAIAAGVRETLGVTLARSRPVERERARAQALMAERYGAASWTRGRIAGPGARGTAVLKTPAGLVRVYAGVQGDSLSSVMLAGDFSIMPPGLLALEAALRWCRAAPSRIAAVAREVLQDGELGIDPGEVASAIWAAAQSALQRTGEAAPVRLSGSCYFPERADAASEQLAREVPA